MMRKLKVLLILLLAVAMGATSSVAAVADTRSTYIIMPAAGAADEVGALLATLGETPDAQLALVDDLFIVDLMPDTAAQLADNPLIAFVELDAPVSTSATQNPTPSWGLDRIDGTMDGVFRFPDEAGDGVKVYVFDTGVDATHPDLAGRVSQGFDAIGNNQANTDCHFHGTHVAATIAGTKFGVAKNASVIPLRVLGCTGSGSISGVIRAINWTIATHSAGDAAVANFSLGGGRTQSLNQAIANLVDAGITTVVAAGNSYGDACSYSPSSAPEAITVGATDRFDNRASFSNFGECVDGFAPGVSIPSADARNHANVLSLSGTSMAAPHVAGIAALILSQSPNARPDQVEAFINELSRPGIVNNARTDRGNRMSVSPAPGATPLPSLPGAPGGLAASNSGRGFVEFSWNNIAGATSYEVEFRKIGENTFTKANSEVAKFRVTGLAGGEQASLRVRAVTERGTTRFSSTVVGTAAIQAPSAARNLNLTAISKTAAELTWDQPESMGGTASATYRVEMRTTGNWQSIATGPSRVVRLSDLKFAHDFRVFAINSAGESEASVIATFDPSKVLVVNSVSVSNIQAGKADLSWTTDAPSSTQFQITLTRTTGSTSTQTFTSEGTSFTLTGLARVTSYRVTVLPLGSVRGISASTTFSVGAVAPSAPRSLSSSKVEAGWQLRFGVPSDNGGAAITGYRLDQLVDGAWTSFKSSTAPEFTVPEPLRGRSVDYRAVAINASGESLPSAAVRVTTPAVAPSSPSDFQGEVLADGRVSLSWAASVDDGGSEITGYRVEVLRSGVWNAVLTQRTLTLVSQVLRKGESANFRVVAVNRVGISAASSVITLARPTSVPSDITSLNTSVSGSAINLSWIAPTDNGGSSILRYQVEKKTGSDWTVVGESANSTSFRLEGLEPGESITLRVRAVTSVGLSVAGVERSVRMPFQVSSAPTSFTVTLDVTRVKFGWMPPEATGGSPVTFYIVSASINGGVFRTVANVRGTERIAYASLPAPGVTTVYRIHAVTSGAGTGLYSAGVSIDMPATVPSDPSNLSSQIRAGEGIFLRWNAPSSDGGSAITGYRVEVRTGGRWVALEETTETSFLAPLGEAGVSLEHRVLALNAAGASLGTRSLFTRMGIAPATAPQSTKAERQSGRLKISWLAPAVMGGQFSRYEIQALENGSFRSVGTARTPELTLSLHAPGTTRVFRVAAVTNAGTGAWSTEIEVASPKVVPSTPIWTSIGSVGRTNTVNWRTTGINNGGGELDQAILLRDDSGSWVEVARADVSAGTLSFANTTFGISHRYVLRFTNEVGSSANSTILTIRHAVVATGPVTGLTAVPEGNSLRLSWTSPEFTGGSAPRSIEIQSSVDGSSWIRVGQFNYATSALVSLPAKGAAISYRVISRNLAGNSEPSSAVSYTTPRTLPGTDFSVSPIRSGNQVLFRITAPSDFGGFSELSVRIERQGTLAWQSSEEFRLTRPRSSFIFGLELPAIRGTYVYRVAIVNPLGEVERTVTFRY
jgi:subtilisin family serine protease